MDVLYAFKMKIESWNSEYGLTSDHVKINIRMQNPCQEPTMSSKAQNVDLKDMDVLCTFKIQIESPNLDNGCVKDQ